MNEENDRLQIAFQYAQCFISIEIWSWKEKGEAAAAHAHLPCLSPVCLLSPHPWRVQVTLWHGMSLLQDSNLVIIYQVINLRLKKDAIKYLDPASSYWPLIFPLYFFHYHLWLTLWMFKQINKSVQTFQVVVSLASASTPIEMELSYN